MKLAVVAAADLLTVPAFSQSNRILLALVVETPKRGGHGSLWRTSNQPIRGFVRVTSNETQQVTTITPR